MKSLFRALAVSATLFLVAGCGANSSITQSAPLAQTSSASQLKTETSGATRETETITRTFYPIPSGHVATIITAGPDGRMWFTERTGQNIGAVDASGNVTEYPVPSGYSENSKLVAGPSALLYILLKSATSNDLFSVDASGTFLLVQSGVDPNFFDLSLGPSNSIWGTGGTNTKIQSLIPLATPISMPTGVVELTGGSDGRVWCTASTASAIYAVDSAGTVVTYAVPLTNPALTNIVSGTDGNLYAVASNPPATLVKMTTAGVETSYPMTMPSENLQDLTATPDGKIWFTILQDHYGKISPKTGVITVTATAAKYGGDIGIAAGPNRTVWTTFTNAYLLKTTY